MYPYHVIDVETTGLSPDSAEICELAIITCEGTKVIDLYHRFFSVVSMNQGAYGAHGLSLEMLRGWPSLKNKELVQDIKSRIRHKIFAHNASFDARFLCSAGLITGNHVITDTLALCRNDTVKLENNKLVTWLQYYGIPHQNHSALSDAFGLYRLITLKGWQIY